MFDQNRDGRLDEGERAAAIAFADSPEVMNAEVTDKTRRFDKNGDGKIDGPERAELNAFVNALRTFASVQMREQLLQRFDVNANGRIDPAEMEELEKFVRPRIESTPAQLHRFDTN